MFTIEVDDRDFDVANITNALKIPAEREYIAEITVDEPTRGQVVFTGDVRLQALDGDVLVVAEWSEDDPESSTRTVRRIDVADIRRISFY